MPWMPRRASLPRPRWGPTPASLVGTLPYMAPEQVEGRSVDARTDIFALGGILYEMTAGRRAFTGESPASLIAAILEHDPEPLSAAQAVPAGIRTAGSKVSRQGSERAMAERERCGRRIAVARNAGLAAGRLLARPHSREARDPHVGRGRRRDVARRARLAWPVAVDAGTGHASPAAGRAAHPGDASPETCAPPRSRRTGGRWRLQPALTVARSRIHGPRPRGGAGHRALEGL